MQASDRTKQNKINFHGELYILGLVSRNGNSKLRKLFILMNSALATEREIIAASSEWKLEAFVPYNVSLMLKLSGVLTFWEATFSISTHRCLFEFLLY